MLLAALKSANESEPHRRKSPRDQKGARFEQADMLRKSPSFPVVRKEVTRIRDAASVEAPEVQLVVNQHDARPPSENLCSAIA